jgi:hypothetical protein
VLTFYVLAEVAATSPSASAGVVATFLQFGVLGGFALVALWFFMRVYKRESDRADREATARYELEREIRDKVIPVLTEFTRAGTELVGLVATLRDRERR